MVKNPPANAGYTGWIPGWRRSRMPHRNQARAPQLLGLGSTACAQQQEKLPQWEARIPRLESSLHLLQLQKSLCTAMKTRHSKKKKKKGKLNEWIAKLLEQSQHTISASVELTIITIASGKTYTKMWTVVFLSGRIMDGCLFHFLLGNFKLPPGQEWIFLAFIIFEWLTLGPCWS